MATPGQLFLISSTRLTEIRTKPAASDDDAQLSPFVEVQWIIGIIRRHGNASNMVRGTEQQHVALSMVRCSEIAHALCILKVLDS